LFIIAFLIYFITSPGKTPYDYFTRLASAFLEGKIYLTDNPPWFSELVPAENGKFYVVYPPMPAILAMPLVLFFGKEFQQQILAHLVGASIVVTSFSLAKKFTNKKGAVFWFVSLAAIGTIIWFEASVGSVWYLGQITAVLFMLLAINESLGQKRIFLIGLFIGAAYLSRVHTILSLPFFVYLNKEKIVIKPKKLLLFGLGISIFIIFNAYYNLARWGVPWDRGYFLIPGLWDEPWFSKGLLHISYIPRHLEILFFKLPKFIDRFPYIIPSWHGLSIILTTPAFFFALKNNLKENDIKLAWFAILLIFLVIALRGGTGWTQFGYRYAVDFYPFLIYLTVKRVSKTGIAKVHWFLLTIGVLVNFWGVIWINKFGWVDF